MKHPFAPGWWRHRAVPQQSLPAGSWEFYISPGLGLFLGSHSSRAEMLVCSVVFRRSLVLSPPAWSPPQLFVSVGQIWVGIAIFPWRLCRWCAARPWALRQNSARLNVVCSEQGYVQERLRENSNVLLRYMEFSGMSSQWECFPSVYCSGTPWDLPVEEAVEWRFFWCLLCFQW